MVDVIINVYGKPWQTLCTLKSLEKHSGQHIDKIYFIEEKEQPYNAEFKGVISRFKNIAHYIPEKYKFFSVDESDRMSIRYQYGIETSDKNFVFITHNDVLYTEDVIGNMLNEIGDSIGIGQIGQCWNCPANKVCSGEKFYKYNPTYEEVLDLGLPHVRTTKELIDKDFPKPLPECRLNEWACMLNRELVVKENIPFGLYDKLDLGSYWFKEMHKKGYTFKDYRKDFTHGFWANNAGFPTQLDINKYNQSELNAYKYYNDNF